ncbi:Cytochrome-c peroxidase [Flavobacterium sp. 9AF]|uniref:cytochrome-c peroxidase n=1 Tax=Flavobacterium sp. 9AF TaxID=2653142 RepID=UPI0012EF74CC|nr:cytochrome c peroxidase [Flavobacterium sp. 9AF]VXC40549.1 Cytochrome-c peroxidase [Flavobacterium sp. 9AF]
MRKIVIVAVLQLFISCSSDKDSEYQNIPIDYQVPSNFPPLAYNMEYNPLTEKGFELGKKIFYDGRLASDGVVACGFCHIQENAFTHHGHTFSHGVGEGIGTRNAPPIQNMAYQTQFFWDGAANHIELLSMVPISNELEMNGNIVDIITMMQNDTEYKKLYKQAFDDGAINSENMLKALAQFMTMLTSSNSRFDKYRRNESGGELTSEELEGYALFNQKCASCHATDIFTDNSFRNNGLSINPQIQDNGRYRVTELEEDKYKFKVPSLRNIEKTAPYMHDGRFFTLEAVLNHYANGVVNTQNLDASLNQNGVLGIPLTNNEKVKIIVFLKTLTDNAFLTDIRFAEF